MGTGTKFSMVLLRAIMAEDGGVLELRGLRGDVDSVGRNNLCLFINIYAGKIYIAG